MRIDSEMSLLYQKTSIQMFYQGFIDEQLTYLILVSNKQVIHFDVYSYILPKYNKMLATISTHFSKTYTEGEYTKGFINMANDQRSVIMYNTSRSDIVHFFYHNKVASIQQLASFLPDEGVITKKNHLMFYNKEGYRVCHSYLDGNNHKSSIIKYGDFSKQLGEENIFIYSLQFNSTSKTFYGSAEGNRVFFFKLSEKATIIFTDKQFQDIYIDSSHIYSLDSEEENKVLSVRYNLGQNKKIQFNQQDYLNQDYKDMCFGKNRIYALIITQTSAVIVNTVNMKIVKNLQDSTIIEDEFDEQVDGWVVQCFANDNYFGVLYSSSKTSQIAVYSQDTSKFNFLGMVNATQNTQIMQFVITKNRVLYISQSTLFSSSIPPLSSSLLQSKTPNIVNDGILLQLSIYNDNVYVLQEKCLIVYNEELKQLASLKITSQQQSKPQILELSSNAHTIQTSVFISMTSNFYKMVLDPIHKLVWIESQSGDILVHDIVKLKQIQTFNDPLKNQLFAHSFIFTSDDAIICWETNCLEYLNKQTISTNENDLLTEQADSLIQFNLNQKVKKVVYDEMSQSFWVCSIDGEVLNIYSRSGQLLNKMDNQQNNSCYDMLIDIVTNRVYFLGKESINIYDLSYMLIYKQSNTYQNTNYLRNPFVYPLMQEPKDESQKLYIPNRDGYIKIYNIHNETLNSIIHIEDLQSVKVYNDDYLIGQTKNELLLINRLTKNIIKRDSFSKIMFFQVFQNSSQVFVAYDLGKVRMFNYNKYNYIVDNLSVNLNCIITLIETDGQMMIAADTLNNIYDINTLNNSFTKLPYSVLSDVPISQLVINSKHGILVVIYDGWKAKMFSRKGVNSSPLEIIQSFNAREQFKISSRFVIGVIRKCIYEEDRQLVYFLTENLGKLYVFQYQNNFSKVKAYKLLNVPVRQSNSLSMRIFEQIKVIALITPYQIDLINQDNLLVFQSLRDINMLYLTDINIITANKGIDTYAIVTSTTNLFIYQYDKENYTMKFLQKFSLNKPTLLHGYTKIDEPNILQLFGFTEYGGMFGIQINLQCI